MATKKTTSKAKPKAKPKAANTNTPTTSKTTANASYHRYIVAMVGVLIFTYVFDYLVHGKLFMQMYIETANIWRGEDEMKVLMPLCFFLHFAAAAVFTSFYSLFGHNTDTDARKYPIMGPGLHFGVHIGLIMAIGMLFSYMMLPISMELALGWFAAAILKGLGIGLVLSAIIHNKKI